jgi:hypothetical protein
LDGIELKIDLGLAYFIVPTVPPVVLVGGQTEPTAAQLVEQERLRLYALWRLGDASKVADGTAKPQLAQATRRVVGQVTAITAVSSGREAIRVAVLNLLAATLPSQGLSPIGLTLGGVVADEAVRQGWIEGALKSIDPAFSAPKLEQMRIAALSGAGTIVVPGNSTLHVNVPGPAV